MCSYAAGGLSAMRQTCPATRTVCNKDPSVGLLTPDDATRPFACSPLPFSFVHTPLL
jgi:hypothetical protein